MSGVQTLDIISVNIWQILISLVNLVLLFLIVKRFLFKPVMNVLSQRKSQIQHMYDEADASRNEASEMKSAYEVKLASAREEADGLVRTAMQTAQRKTDALLEEAKSEASHIRKKAEADIAQEKRQMLAQAREEISDLAVSIAEKVMEREIDQQDHKRFVDDFIRNVGEHND